MRSGSELRVACNTRTVGLPAGRCAVSGEARGLSGAQAHSLTTPAGSASGEAPDGFRGGRPASASPSSAASSGFPLWDLPDGELNYPGCAPNVKVHLLPRLDLIYNILNYKAEGIYNQIYCISLYCPKYIFVRTAATTRTVVYNPKNISPVS